MMYINIFLLVSADTTQSNQTSQQKLIQDHVNMETYCIKADLIGHSDRDAGTTRVSRGHERLATKRENSAFFQFNYIFSVSSRKHEILNDV